MIRDSANVGSLRSGGCPQGGRSAGDGDRRWGLRAAPARRHGLMTLLPLILWMSLAVASAGLATGVPAAPAGADGSVSITFASLLEEMIDRDALARYPDPAYRCVQYSSYDRASTTPDDPDTWFANWDRSQFIRVDERALDRPRWVEHFKHADVVDVPVREGFRREYVLADVSGPGAVVRLWATWHGERGQEPFRDGTLRIYLDDDYANGHDRTSAPVSEIVGGSKLCGPPLSQGVSPLTNPAWQGHNLYLPIPFSSRCVITYETDALIDVGALHGEALYYQINLRLYEPGTQVEPWTPELISQEAALLEQVQATLAESATGGPRAEANEGVVRVRVRDATIDVDNPVQASIESESLGAATVSMIELAIEAADLEQALRSTILTIAFDDVVTVRAPVGDFFGIGHRLRPTSTWQAQVTEDGIMRCFWRMPFRERMDIRLEDALQSPSSTEVHEPVVVRRLEVRTTPWSWDADRDMYFHAGWSGNFELPTRAERAGTEVLGPTDIRYAAFEGRGVLVGDALTIFNRYPTWWGEGDEKIYVDGEAFPSHFGTGTEDYYGYAWCRPEVFTAPFHAQPDGSGNLAGGYAVNVRQRTLDAIPFERSLIFDMELWHHRETTVDFCPTVYWYARPGSTSDFEAIVGLTEAAARPVPRDREGVWKPEVKRVAGAIEAEDLKMVVAPTSGNVSLQNVAAFGFSGGSQVWWVDGVPGDSLTLRVPLPAADDAVPGTGAAARQAEGPMRYRVIAALTRANDYAMITFEANGMSSPASPVDGYHPDVVVRETILGVFALPAGADHVDVRITIAGANEAAIPRHMVGIDYFRIEAVPR